MREPKKDNARGKAGKPITKRAGRVNGKNKAFRCGVKHTSNIRRELDDQGLALRSVTGASQRATLLRVFEYLGDRGLNTLEGVACGFYRIATRVQELEAEGWLIDSRRERVLGADGLVHDNVARYVLRGRKSDVPDPQGILDLEVMV